MKSSIPFPPEPEGWNQRLLSHETKNTLSLIPHLSAIGPPITQPRRSPITNKLAEMIWDEIKSLFSTFRHNFTNPWSLLQCCWYISIWLLKLWNKNCWEAHGQTCTETRQVGHYPCQELKQIMGIWTISKPGKQ